MEPQRLEKSVYEDKTAQKSFMVTGGGLTEAMISTIKLLYIV